jgi:hypothetical protein
MFMQDAHARQWLPLETTDNNVNVFQGIHHAVTTLRGSSQGILGPRRVPLARIAIGGAVIYDI